MITVEGAYGEEHTSVSWGVLSVALIPLCIVGLCSLAIHPI